MKNQKFSETLQTHEQPDISYDPRMGSWKSSEELTEEFYTSQSDWGEKPLLVLKPYRIKVAIRTFCLLILSISFLFGCYLRVSTHTDFTLENLLIIVGLVSGVLLFPYLLFRRPLRKYCFTKTKSSESAIGPKNRQRYLNPRCVF